MTSFRRSVLLTASLCLLVPALSAQRQGGDCSYLVANQTYANTFQGFLNIPVYFAALNLPTPPGMGLVPNAGAGKITFFSGGTAANVETISIGWLGLKTDVLINGPFKLSWDTGKTPALCSGTFSGSDGQTNYNFQLIVTQNGRRVEMIHTDAGLVVGASSVLMETRGCHNSAIAGSYSYNTLGWALAPGYPVEQSLANTEISGLGYVPGSMSGAMRFYPKLPPSKSAFPDAPAGSGTVLAWDTLSANGTILKRTMTGWYKVDPLDCQGTIVLNDNVYPPYQIEVFVGADGETLHAVNVNVADPKLGIGPVPTFLMPISLERVSDGEDQ
ncbi:hypothetical protein P8935_17310 [Telmatobacter sp. DSM 110680]|uniref:Uncharacterized protein n=1 Tax=Telmatobacter sp. DSM 110680 TaxID=3036704 RepID=A0AAU7DG50_9BACT